MPSLSLDSREVTALVLLALGLVVFGLALWSKRGAKPARTHFLVGISIFMVASAAYMIEQDIHRWFGVSTADNLALHFTDFIWWVALTYLLTRVLDVLLWRGLFTQNGQAMVPMILVHAINLGLYIVAGLLFTRYVLHKDVTLLLTTSGVLLVALGYLAKSPFESAFAGLAINIAPMFKKGDLVRIGSSIGMVEDIGWQYVVLRTREEDLLYLPNLQVREEVVVNFSEAQPLFHHHEIEVTLEYTVPIQKGRQLIESALSELDDVKSYLVFAMHFSEYGIVYQIRFWIAHHRLHADVVHAIHSSIYYKIQREPDFDFGYNKFLSLNATHISQRASAMHPHFLKAIQLSMEQRIQLLKAVEIFRSLDDGEITQLAQSCGVSLYGPNEKVIKEGDSGNSMFVVARGTVQICIQSEAHVAIEVAVDKTGQYFGEMALLTGTPRRATAKALEESVLLEIPKSGLQSILEKRPSLAGDIAAAVTQRQMQNEILLSEAEHLESIKSKNKKLADALKKSVQQFFGLKVEP